MFPGVEKSVWRWDQQAGQYYRHMFYRHEPDLNLVHSPVIDEIDNILRFWLRVGVSGFRLDAASHWSNKPEMATKSRGTGYWPIFGNWLNRPILKPFCSVKLTWQ